MQADQAGTNGILDLPLPLPLLLLELTANRLLKLADQQKQEAALGGGVDLMVWPDSGDNAA